MNKALNRRSFLRTLGGGAAAVAASSIALPNFVIASFLIILFGEVMVHMAIGSHLTVGERAILIMVATACIVWVATKQKDTGDGA